MSLSSLTRPAALVDLERIAQLERECFAEPWPESLLRGEFAHPGSIVLVATPQAGVVAGYASFRLGAGEAELLRVGVTTRFRGHGIGTGLITTGLRRVAQAGATRCFLEVRQDNMPARHLYERLGFVANGERPSYYRDGTPAILYGINLPPLPRPRAG